MQESTKLNLPFIFVAVNYRLAAFGFLPGKELQEEVSIGTLARCFALADRVCIKGGTNLGLRDQRAGLRWVAENIEAFGGDPDKVTIWVSLTLELTLAATLNMEQGESAGAMSVTDHLIVDGGDNTYRGRALFRGAIMDSGATIAALSVTSRKAQNVFDVFVESCGCAKSHDKLGCLRSLPYEEFLRAQNRLSPAFGKTGLNFTYIPRPDPANNFFGRSPEIPFRNGEFTRVPMISGNQEDEGVIWSLLFQNVTTTAKLVEYFEGYWTKAPKHLIEELVSTYPTNPSAGSPFRTGRKNEVFPNSKRMAALMGDAQFVLQRRAILPAISSVVPVWSYQATYLHGASVLGTYHSSDVLEYFTSLPYADVARAIRAYYINFIANLDPNIGAVRLAETDGVLHWPRWQNDTRELIRFRNGSQVLIKDDFRQDSFDVLSKYQSVFRQ